MPVRRILLASFVLWLALAPRAALAVIETLTPLTKFEADSTVIVLAKVEQLNLEKQQAVLVVERSLKGEFASPRLPLRLEGDTSGASDPNDLLDRLEEGQQVVLFSTEGASQLIGYAYTRGSWFQVLGSGEGDRVVWRFTHAEPYLGRTYHGDVSELVRLLDEAIAGTGKLPEPDTSVKPGLGPKVDRSTMPPAENTADAKFPKRPETTHESPSPAVETASLAPHDLRGWYAVAGTIVLGALGLVYLQLRGGPA